MHRLIERTAGPAEGVEALETRHALLDRLSRIQRSISHGAPLNEVFSAIAAGAADLLGEPVSGLRVVDEDDPARMLLVAAVGLTPEQVAEVRMGNVGEGAGGRAILEGRVVVVEDYPAATDGIARFGEFGVQNALAAPIRVEGRVVGSLTVASFEAGRRYGAIEQDVLSALAEHAGLALLDASLIDRRERRAERQIEERFQALIRHSTDLIAVVDPEGGVSFATSSVGRALGVEADSLVGTSLLDHLAPADRPAGARLLHRAASQAGSTPPAEWRIVPAGTELEPQRWLVVEVVATNLLAHPSVDGIVLNARDITERRVAEQARRRQDARYRQIVDTTHDGVWMTDRDDRTVFVNEALARMLGRRPEDLIGRHTSEFMDAEQAERVRRAVDRRKRGLHDRYEVTLQRADGSPLHLSISGTPVFENDRFAGALALCGDITELVCAREEMAQLASQLRQAQELEMLGRLAGHVAHDFNQVLSVIFGYANLLESRTTDETVRRDLACIVEAADHGAALARQLVTFSRRGGGDPETLDLAEVARATAQLAAGAAPEGITVIAATGDASLPVRIDPTKLRQVIMNLVDNAFDAMTEGGELLLTAEAFDVVDDADQRAAGLTPGPHVRLVVSDTGEGMPPEVMARALEPAYTTKPSGKGTGLGLSIVHGIVKAASGHIALHSAPHSGTTVEILLPQAAEVAGAEGLEAAARERGQTILLVEDDASVLELTARVLTENGYAVLTATNGADALAIAAEQPVDLLLTDQTMPGASGLELAAGLAELRPGTPTIVMSGYAAEVSALRRSDIEWLQKPFGAHGLLGAVRGVLSRPWPHGGVDSGPAGRPPADTGPRDDRS